jgi:conserved oligomeric Golgi complex subunit 6
MRQSIISVFLARFTLTEAEVEAITSREVPVGRRLFEAMDRAEKIRDDCQILLGGEGEHTKSGSVVRLHI